jgi:hypothetical protein
MRKIDQDEVSHIRRIFLVDLLRFAFLIACNGWSAGRVGVTRTYVRMMRSLVFARAGDTLVLIALKASVSTDDSPRYYCRKQIPQQLNSMRQFNAA